MTRCSPYLSFALPVLLTGSLLLVRSGGPSTGAQEAKAPPEKTFTADEIAFFEKDVRPLLENKCVRCHGGEKVKGKLKLTTRADVLKGGGGGPAVALEAPDRSRLLQAIHWRDGLEMPPSGKLPQKDIDTLTRWVRAGAPWP